MQKIIISSRDGKFKFEKEFTDGKTVYDIKEYISQHIKIVHGEVEKNNIFIFHNESPLKDHIVLSKFNNKELALCFDYTKIPNTSNVNVEEEVTTNPINTKITVKVLENGTKMSVDPSEILTLDNKVYLIKNRSKRIDFNTLIEAVKKLKIGREDVLKVLIFSLLLFTNNGEIVFILGAIFSLRMASGFLSKHNKDFTKKFEHVNRTIFMFIASMFMIDHSRF